MPHEYVHQFGKLGLNKQRIHILVYGFLRDDFFFTLFLGASKILSSFASSRGLSSNFGTFAGFVGSLANKNSTNDSTGSLGLYGKHH